ncbi:hypothetical protein CEE36_04000 [candidate division TA06 bacterium B3_TA06]|uniref:CAAX prenyl protease 2/Lysostaphin resistance protein A-like domain-containing protein n=1 Tax=candidate division TA06 bacterium B3_TA06 TaxID=2012487 RepID=A0A532V8I7_UNCT6|nr:MAG: hypothetical protein CEE36_04000 [candidate division TA06 bacterium B3_TA06]
MDDQVFKIPFRVFRWNPHWGDLVPVGLWIFTSSILQFSRLAGPRAPSLLEWLKPTEDLGFLIAPLLFVRLIEKRGLSFIGITRRHIGLAVAIGLPLGLLAGWFAVSRSFALGEFPLLPDPLQGTAYFLGALYHLAAVEFFYRGWLASRFERSYGFLAAVLGSALLYAFSPLVLWGTDLTVPAAFSSVGFYWGSVFPFTFFVGILLAGVARLTRNLLAPILVMLPQMILGDLLPGGLAHRIGHPESKILGTLALAGIVVVIAWLTRRRQAKKQSTT